MKLHEHNVYNYRGQHAEATVTYCRFYFTLPRIEEKASTWADWKIGLKMTFIYFIIAEPIKFRVSSCKPRLTTLRKRY